MLVLDANFSSSSLWSTAQFVSDRGAMLRHIISFVLLPWEMGKQN